MFGFFRKPSPPGAAPSCHCLLGWRVLTLQQGENWLSLQVEPMKDGPCRVYLPSAERWLAEAPAWAREQREALLAQARRIAWNRDLLWTESPRARFWHRHVYDPVEGSLESTPGGRQLERMKLFHPDSPVRFSKQDAKRAWCSGAEQMCLQAAGMVNIDMREVIAGSVFQEIELPTLQRNPKVTLSFAGVPA